MIARSFLPTDWLESKVGCVYATGHFHLKLSDKRSAIKTRYRTFVVSARKTNQTAYDDDEFKAAEVGDQATVSEWRTN